VAIAFQHPAVWWAALLAALPITIHLLTRAKRRPLIFPSIRFLEATRLAAISRSRPQDLILLLVRVLIILLSVAACAGPIVVTPAREAAWRARVARAVVLDDRTAAPEDEVRSAAVGAVFARARLGDAVSDAVRWLEHQAPTTKEIVVFSAFRRGAAAGADFVAVPAPIGIRLLQRADTSAVREREIARLTWRDGRAVRVTNQLFLTPAETEVREIRAEVLDEMPIRVNAPAAEQPAADAALRAVLRRGLRLPPAGLLESIEVEWPGTVEQLAAVLQARVAAPLDSWEPETLSDQELAAIARPPAPVGSPAPVDAGDRRMAWALVLALLVAETWIRGGAA
jgi:hypothetical protein